MNTSKPWYLSKGIWTGVVTVIIAAYATAANQFGLPPIPEWAFAILGGLGIYSRKAATSTISSGK